MNSELVQQGGIIFLNTDSGRVNGSIKQHIDNLYQPLTLILLGRDNKMIK